MASVCETVRFPNNWLQAVAEVVENSLVQRSRELLTLVALTVMVSATEDERSATSGDSPAAGAGRSRLAALAC